MDNFNPKILAEKAKKALELRRKEAEKKKKKEQHKTNQVVGTIGTLKTKNQALSWAQTTKRVVQTSNPEQPTRKCLSLVDEEELLNYPSRKITVSTSTDVPPINFKITCRFDRPTRDDTFLGGMTTE